MSSEAEVCKPYARPSVIEDVQYLADHIREEDRQEVWHSDRKTPLEAFQIGFENSDEPFTIMWRGSPVGMFGVSGENGIGIPWMLATDDLKKIRKSFLRECRSYVQRMHEKYPVLINMVWLKNEVHIQWLRWLGFEFDAPTQMGPDNEMFIRFYKEATCVPRS
jgi:hypothetical protein